MATVHVCFYRTVLLTYRVITRDTKQAEFHAHDDEVDLEDFCAIMERHQPENLIVVSSGGGNGGESDGEGGGGASENGDGQADGGGGGWGDGKGGSGGSAGGGGSGGGGAGGGKIVVTREEVISNLVELFKEVGDMLS